MIDFSKFKIIENDLNNIRELFELTKMTNIVLPPDLLFLFFNYGQIIKKDLNFQFDGELFHSTFTITEKNEFLEYNKSHVPEANLSEYLVFATTYDPNCYVLIGCNEKNINQLFKYNDALEEEPIYICENIFKFFSEVLQPW